MDTGGVPPPRILELIDQAVDWVETHGTSIGISAIGGLIAMGMWWVLRRLARAIASGSSRLASQVEETLSRSEPFHQNGTEQTPLRAVEGRVEKPSPEDALSAVEIKEKDFADDTPEPSVPSAVGPLDGLMDGQSSWPWTSSNHVRESSHRQPESQSPSVVPSGTASAISGSIASSGGSLSGADKI